MKSVAVASVALLAAGAHGFMAPTLMPSVSTRSSPASSTRMMAAKPGMSKALPFITQPPKLDGTMIGDVGFDPLRFSDTFDLNYIQAAELKHGRVAMLAVVGFLVVQKFHLPGDWLTTNNPFQAVLDEPLSGHAQTVAAIGIFELRATNAMFSSENKSAWDMVPQDPKSAATFYAKPQAEQDKLKLKEIKNGRLAMVAIIGLFVQTAMFGAQYT